MESYLPLILALLALIYRVYTNFQKEQEKARKRNPAQRPVEATEQPYDYHPQTETPHPYLDEEVFIPETRYEPVHPHVPAEKMVWERVEEPKYEPLKAEPVVVKEGRSPEVEAEEVRRSKAIHAAHKHQFVPHEEEEERSPYADFDLHDAVIKSAILNRPEYAERY